MFYSGNETGLKLYCNKKCAREKFKSKICWPANRFYMSFLDALLPSSLVVGKCFSMQMKLKSGN